MPELELNYRYLVRRDLDAIVDIEAHSYYRSPWNEDDFIVTLRNVRCIGMVAEIDNRVVAFIIYEMQKTHLEIINLSVHKDYRRRGIGSFMIRNLASRLSATNRSCLIAYAPDSELSCHLFFRKCGFLATEVDKDHFQFGNDFEDGYRFELYESALVESF
jgi:ribosomal-protein-alanine N-acetyltransferase